MIKIEIHTNQVDEHSGVSRKTGNPFTIRKQEAWAQLPGQPHPLRIKIPLAREQSAYPPGNYSLDSRSFEVNQYGELALRPSLAKAG